MFLNNAMVKNKNEIILLDGNFLPVSKITWKRALKLLLKNKAEGVGDISIDIHMTLFGCYKLPCVIRLLDDRSMKSMRSKFIPFSRKAVYRRDDYKCGYCKSTKDLTLDHIIPVSKGGQNDFDNVVVACNDCNSKKGNKSIKEANMKLLTKIYHPTIYDVVRKDINGINIYDYLYSPALNTHKEN